MWEFRFCWDVAISRCHWGARNRSIAWIDYVVDPYGVLRNRVPWSIPLNLE
jgi:hypothetical protein